jgi:hypothetical protein
MRYKVNNNTVKLGYNELGYKELGYNELGYNKQKFMLVGLGHFYGEFSWL